MSTNVTCSDCLKRMAGLDAKTLRQQYRITVPWTVERHRGQGHATYRFPQGRASIVALCMATPRNAERQK